MEMADEFCHPKWRILETNVGPMNGAKVVARAWTDPDYKARLLSDGTAAIAELGFSGPEGDHMVVVENTADVHNLVVCTLRLGRGRGSRRQHLAGVGGGVRVLLAEAAVRHLMSVSHFSRDFTEIAPGTPAWRNRVGPHLAGRRSAVVRASRCSHADSARAPWRARYPAPSGTR
jgi:hypothetical protein